jgi:hypothetical protein
VHQVGDQPKLLLNVFITDHTLVNNFIMKPTIRTQINIYRLDAFLVTQEAFRET